MDDQVTLEAYADENRALIHNDRNDEAIAICKHILRYFPKQVESYCQLGAAFLEKGEYANATDVFQRVLSADPENVTAHVGMASVLEQRHSIDEAIWHLERANEITPGNFEIQKELLRLYSEAGKPRSRLKLTPAGLARLYDQEGLYAQAIQELRAIIDESPTRFDARVALAETLWHAGRIHESAETAQGILNSLPYCLKANLIVGAAWKESGLPDSATYLNRAQELDPTNKVAARLFGARSPLTVTEISVPRYVEGMPPPPLPQETRTTPLSPEPIEPSEEKVTAEMAAFFAETPTGAAPPAEVPQSPVVEAGVEPAAGAESEKLPAWLEETEEEPSLPSAGLAEQYSAEQAPAWMENSDQPDASFLTAEAEGQAAEPEASEVMPAWLRAPSAPAEEVAPAPQEETAPIEDYVAPASTAPGAEETPPAVAQESSAKQAPPLVIEMPSAQAAASKRKRQPKGYPRLIQAREHRDANRVSDALSEYDWLVQHAPRLVNDVIDDLEALTAREDAPLEAHRILGDAYTRADRLSKALDRYQFVLERTSKSPQAPVLNLESPISNL